MTAESAAAKLCEELYERYRDDVYRYTFALLRGRADAEDATQTTFLNAFRAIARGERPWRPKHWLIAIAHNACRTRAIRAARRPREVPLEWAATVAGPDDADAATLRELLHELAELPENQRRAIVLRELEGRSYVEIAAMLGVTVSAVETLIFRARRTLRRRGRVLRGGWLAWLPAWAHRLASPLAGAPAPEGLAIAAAAATLAAAGTGTAAAPPQERPAARVAPAPVLIERARPSAPVRPHRTQPTRSHQAPTPVVQEQSTAVSQPPAAAPAPSAPSPRARPKAEPSAPASVPAPGPPPEPAAQPGPAPPAAVAVPLPPVSVTAPPLPVPVPLPPVAVTLPPVAVTVPALPSVPGTGQVPLLSGI